MLPIEFDQTTCNHTEDTYRQTNVWNYAKRSSETSVQCLNNLNSFSLPSITIYLSWIDWIIKRWRANVRQYEIYSFLRWYCGCRQASRSSVCILIISTADSLVNQSLSHLISSPIENTWMPWMGSWMGSIMTHNKEYENNFFLAKFSHNNSD